MPIHLRFTFHSTLIKSDMTPAEKKLKSGTDATLELTPSLRLSIKEGIASSSMVGLGETFLGACGIFLEGTIVQIGILATVPQLVAAIFQNVAVWCIDRFPDRRKALCHAAAVNSVIWAPIALIPLLCSPSSEATTLLIALALFYYGSGGFTAPIWNSLMGDLVPASGRGRFFGLRNQICGIATFLSVLCAGVILDAGRDAGRTGFGFAAIFLLAGVARFISRRLLLLHDNPPYHPRPEHRFTFFQFLRRAPYSNFARFTLFSAAINLGVAFAGPYFAVYMLEVLKLSYSQFTILAAIVTVTQFLTIKYWGTLSDRFGNKKILNIAGGGICLAPVLWLFHSEFWYLMLVQMYSGFVWAGYNLATANFIFDAVSQPKLARCAAYHALVVATAFVCGSLAGGYTARHFNDLLELLQVSWRPTSTLLVVFFISGIIRLIGVVLLLPRFKEVRPVEAIRHRRLLFMVMDIRPIAGATFGIITGQWRRKTPKK